MPAKTRVHLDKALSEISVAYKNDRLISPMFPEVPVKHDSDDFFVYDKSNLQREAGSLWARGAFPGRVEFEVSTQSYSLERHALEEIVLDDDKKNSDPAIRLDMDATENLTEKLLLEQEVDLSGLLGAAGNWANTTSLTAGARWSLDTVTSNPIVFIDSASSVVGQNSGKLPNTVVMNDAVFRYARNHQSVIDRTKHTSSDSVSKDMLAKLFDVDQVMVAGAIINSGEEGLADSMGYIWTDTVNVLYLEKSPGLKKPSAVYRFVKAGEGLQTFRYREERAEGDVLRVKKKFQHRAVASDCAYAIIDAAA